MECHKCDDTHDTHDHHDNQDHHDFHDDEIFFFMIIIKNIMIIIIFSWESWHTHDGTLMMTTDSHKVLTTMKSWWCSWPSHEYVMRRSWLSWLSWSIMSVMKIFHQINHDTVMIIMTTSWSSRTSWRYHYDHDDHESVIMTINYRRQ